MLSVTSAQLSEWLALFFLPLGRVLGLLIAAPVLGNQRLPLRARVGLALMITAVIAPALPPPPPVAPDTLAGLGLFAQQLLIGLVMGFAVRLVFTMVEIAGDYIGLQMGLGFALFFDPQQSTQIPVVGQFLGLIATLLFLAFDGHLMMISVLADSFRWAPIGAGIHHGIWQAVAGWGGNIFHAALLLSLPVTAILLTVNIALGVLTRAAPQLNVFAVGFPVTLAVGFAAMLLSLPHLSPQFEELLRDSMARMQIFSR